METESNFVSLIKKASLSDFEAERQITKFHTQKSFIEKKKDFHLLSLEKIDDQGVIENALGWCYIFGYGCDKDSKKSDEFFLSSAKKKLPLGLYNNDSSFENERSYLIELIETKEDFWCMTKLGKNILGRKTGFDKDGEETGFYWLQRAADHLDLAKMEMGIIHMKDKEYAKAFDCFEKGAKSSIAVSFYNLSIMFDEGMGKQRNQERSLEYLLKSEELGSLEALQRIPKVYEELNKYKEAIAWYEKGANVTGCFQKYNEKMAKFFLKGLGVKKDLLKYIHFLRLAGFTDDNIPVDELSDELFQKKIEILFLKTPMKHKFFEIESVVSIALEYVSFG